MPRGIVRVSPSRARVPPRNCLVTASTVMIGSSIDTSQVVYLQVNILASTLWSKQDEGGAHGRGQARAGTAPASRAAPRADPHRGDRSLREVRIRRDQPG